MQFAQNQYTKRFIECINYLRENKLVDNYADITRDLDYAKQSLSQILNGKINVTMDLVSKFCTKYGLSVNYILLGDGNITTSQNKGQVVGSGNGSGNENNQDIKQHLDRLKNYELNVLPNVLPNHDYQVKLSGNISGNTVNEPAPTYGNAGKKEEGLKELSTALKAYMEANNALMAYISTLEAKLSNYEGNNDSS